MSETSPKLRAELEGIPTYKPGKPAAAGGPVAYKLSSNENPYPPLPGVMETVTAAVSSFNRYPDMACTGLMSELSDRFGVPLSHLATGTGSVGVAQQLIQATSGPGDEVIYAWRSFEAYPIITQISGARSVQVPLTSGEVHDLDAMAAAITDRTRIVLVCTPNNPTGPAVTHAEVAAFLAKVPSHVVVVLDEAYDEYLDEADQSPAIGWVVRHPNLVVSRTFSKAYGLAALRIGYGVMEPSVADMLNRVRQPFNVNALAQAAAIAALGDAGYVAESARLNREGLRRLEEGLAALGVATLPSHGNFILARVGDAARIYGDLLRQGVIVRPVAGYGLPEWLRITVGLPAENERFLAALGESLGR